MNSEKVKEIKDCLLWNGDRRLSYTNTDFKKVYVFYDDILTLINELESENKELKKYKLDWLNSEKMHLQADMEDTEFELLCANKSLDEVRAENKKLKERIALLEKESERFVKNFEKNRVLDKGQGLRKGCYYTLEAVEYISKAREDCKLVDFAKRLKEELKGIVGANFIDETLKEFINE